MNSELIYQPAEDSYLLSRVLIKQKIPKNWRILEIGAGSGIQARTLIRNKNISNEKITLSDINDYAVKKLRENFPGIRVICSDLFKNIPKEEKFDLIIFNPPYLPKNIENLEDKDSELITTGGFKGSEIINKFLSDSEEYLNKNGKILLLTSSLTKNINWIKWKRKILDEEKLFMEKLWVWELRK